MNFFDVKETGGKVGGKVIVATPPPPCYEMWPFPRVYILGKSTNALHLIAIVIFYLFSFIFYFFSF